MMKSRRRFLALGAAAGALAARPSLAVDPLKVGFVYNSPVGDAGWTYQHDQGRLAVEAAHGAAVVTTKVESVTEAGVEGVLRQLVEEGHKLVFTTSFGFMNPTLEVAADSPGVVFEHATGYKLADNVGTYQARDYEARYLSGIVAGGMSKSGVAGFIASVPIPEVVRGINAFTLGMRSVNPAATVKVVWLNSWYDPGREREATDALITQGVDVINQFTDSGAPTQAAEARGVWSISVGSDRSSYGPAAHLTSVIYTWGDFYADVARRVMEGSWKSAAVWGGLAAGMTDISPLNAAVPADLAELVAARRSEIVESKRHPFEGPIRDQAGAEKLPEGAVLSDEDLLGMAWFAEGVDGTIPQ
jgi:simple sugar transport system substrate-binding protein